MSILLSTEPTEVVLGVVYWILIILGIVILVKFFQIAKDVRSIRESIEDIADSIVKDEDEEEEDKPIYITQKTVNTQKTANKSVDKKQDMIMVFINDCLKIYKRCNSKEEFESRVDEIVTKYNKKGDFDYSTLKNGLWEQFERKCRNNQ